MKVNGGEQKVAIDGKGNSHSRFLIRDFEMNERKKADACQYAGIRIDLLS
jgi:hypothetical protein